MPSELPVELGARAARDIKRMDAPERRRIRSALQELAAGTENLDIKPLSGQQPWLRLRTGDWRVLYRPYSPAEEAERGPGLLVARVVNRRDLLKAVRTLTI